MPVLTLSSPEAAIAAAAAQSRDAAIALDTEIRQQLLEAALAPGARSIDFSDEELQYLPREIKVRLWRQTYEALVADYTPRPELATWVATMTEKHGGPLCSIFGHPVSWLVGLRLALWGEEPRHWPADWQDADVLRANAWAAGAHPRTVVYLTGENPRPLPAVAIR